MFFVPLLATLGCWYLSPNEITPPQAILAFALMVIPWSSYLVWRSERRREVPLFAILAAMHWIYFAQPLFWGDRRIPGVAFEIPQDQITATLAMVVLGVVCLWLGIHTEIELWSPKRLPDLVDSPTSWTYLRALMWGGIAIGFWSSGIYAFGAEGRQLMILVQTVLPSTVFAFFFRKYVRGEAQQADRVLVVAFLASRVVIGLSSGWLSTIIWPGVICVLVYVAEGKHIPIKSAVVVAACVLFLQVGKIAFREAYWGGEEGTMIDRIEFWIEQSASGWSQVAQESGGSRSQDLASLTISRLSLLTQAAHVLEWTPEKVPFQYGRTYSYMAVTLVPRLLWPGKPSMSEANQFYQVAYGLTSEDRLDRVSIAVGFLIEGYINFGWLGVIGITYLVGVVLGIFQRMFLNEQSGMLFGSLGLALIPGFLILESQLSQYLSGIVQQVILMLVVLLPVVKPRANRLLHRANSGPRTGAAAVRQVET
jgi:hypothetical protein